MPVIKKCLLSGTARAARRAQNGESLHQKDNKNNPFDTPTRTIARHNTPKRNYV
jgi:hypothetical protein